MNKLVLLISIVLMHKGERVLQEKEKKGDTSCYIQFKKATKNPEIISKVTIEIVCNNNESEKKKLQCASDQIFGLYTETVKVEGKQVLPGEKEVKNAPKYKMERRRVLAKERKLNGE